MKRRNKELFIIAHNIRSLHNVGSIFRTADAFGVAKIYLTGYTGAPIGNNAHKISKVALGAEAYVPWEQSKSVARLVKKLHGQGIKVVALENNVKNTVPLKKFKKRFPMALLLGEETKGHTKKLLELVDDIVEIPMQGKKESLNVSIACGIALYGLIN